MSIIKRNRIMQEKYERSFYFINKSLITFLNKKHLFVGDAEQNTTVVSSR